MPGGLTIWFGLLMGLLASCSLALLWWLDVIRPGSFVRLGRRSDSAFGERRRMLLSGWPASAAGAWLVFAMMVFAGLLLHVANRFFGDGAEVEGVEGAGSGGVALAATYVLLGLVTLGIAAGVNVVCRRLAGDGGGEGGGGRDVLGLVPTFRGVWGGVAGFVLVMPVLLVVGLVSRMVDRLVRGEVGDPIAHDTLRELVSEGAGSASFWWTSFTVTVPVPVYEELLYRGLVQSAVLGAWVAFSTVILRRRMAGGGGGGLGGGGGGVGGGGDGGGWLAVLVVSCLFALMHAGIADMVAMPTYIVLSIALGVVYERTGRIVAPVVLHGLFNATQIGLAMMLTVEGAGGGV